MPVTLESLGIDKLSVEDRISLVQLIWDSIPARPPISEELRDELDRRIAEDEADPDGGIPWEVVKTEALARLGK
jgi:putative addiction module component (TIGR02574 family)